MCILIFSNVGELRFRSCNPPKVTQLGNSGARLQVCLTPENNVTLTQQHIVMQLLYSSRFKGMTNMLWLMFMREGHMSSMSPEDERTEGDGEEPNPVSYCGYSQLKLSLTLIQPTRCSPPPPPPHRGFCCQILDAVEASCFLKMNL